MKFIKPNFAKGEIELRVENDEVCIYATSAGLEKLASFCNELISNPRKGHIHLEDYELLTENSMKGTIALLEKN
ncbi:hypothetical protein [Geobacter sp. AOG1]|uniref:Imm32 family immunity protein n=1 Tax=Geobacter sp. AOG1 TaxID=1566346 RepID=UPI001CC4CCD3|nr:hypothetical protein [Geobacter sp. AOG1]GFE56724.1 hypothetical protein AOG1_06030 [Geobacter sp. AOG1]